MQTRSQFGFVETTDKVKQELRCCERKDPTLFLISLLVKRILQLLKDKNESSMKVFQELMSHLIVRETKRQQRILGFSEEQSINVRITGDISLLNRIPHSVVRFLNRLNIGRRWRKPMVQFGEKIWFQKIDEERTGLMLPRIVAEELLAIERGKFYVFVCEY